MDSETAAAAGAPEISNDKGVPSAEEARGSQVPPASTTTLSATSPTSGELPRVDVSAGTITRMMGIASSSDLRLLEGRIDLLTTKVSGLVAKVDRITSMLGNAPAASDIDRLEIQIGTLKSLIKEVLEVISIEGDKRSRAGERAAAQEQSRKLREGIKTSEE